MRFTESDGLRVGYRQDGQGPAIVLVHGTGGDGASNWDQVAKDLARDFTVLRPDYSGSGQTGDDDRPLTVARLARQVLAAMDEAGQDRVCLVGFSLGAAIAARIAADHPERVGQLVLIAGFAQLDARLALQFGLWRDLIGSDRAAMARLVLLTGFSPAALSLWGEAAVEQAVDDMVKTQNWAGMARQVDLDLRLDVSDAPTRITAPTLVIGGALDHMVPPAHAQGLAAAIAGARYLELPTGHLAPMERPDLVAAAIRSVATAGR